MKVKFLKNHPSGLRKDAERNINEKQALRLKEEGYVELLEEPSAGSGSPAVNDSVKNPWQLDEEQLKTATVLKVNKKYLKDNTTVKDAGVQEGDEIYVAAEE